MKRQSQDELLIRTFAKVNAVALGIACSFPLSLGIFAATAILLVKGGQEIGPNLILLAQYLPGYSVTWPGSLIGGLYGIGYGFLAGWTLAFLRNFAVTAYLHGVRLRASLSADHFLDRFDS